MNEKGVSGMIKFTNFFKKFFLFEKVDFYASFDVSASI